MHILSVIIRTLIEAGFLYMQFHLFGFEVPMVYYCHSAPCPQRTECWVSRAKEKTIFLWFMFIIGKIFTFHRIIQLLFYQQALCHFYSVFSSSGPWAGHDSRWHLGVVARQNFRSAVAASPVSPESSTVSI